MHNTLLYRGDIQGLRALAVGLVVAAHFGLPGFGAGFIGVDMFFVISGYVISGLILNKRNTDSGFSYLLFYARRIQRLFPALFFMLLITSIASYIFYSPKSQSGWAMEVSAALVWLSNFYFAFRVDNYFQAINAESLFIHTWSLGVEEQFYLIWPILFVACIQRSFSKLSDHPAPKISLAAISLIVFASFILCIFLTPKVPIWSFYMVPTRLWEFGVGSIACLWVYYFAPKYSQLIALISGYIGFAGFFLLLLAMIFTNSKQLYPFFTTLLPVGATLFLLLAGVANAQSFLTRLLSYRPVTILGDLSYSIYLWHWPVWVLFGLFLIDDGIGRVSLSLVTVLVIATFSHFVIEKPIRNIAIDKYRAKKVYLVSIILLLFGVAVAQAWGWASDKWRPNPDSGLDIAASDMPSIYQFGCDQWYHSSDVQPCVFGNDKASNTVVLVGDSIAGQWFPAIATLFNAPDWRLIVYTKSACPMLDVEKFYERIGRVYTECAIWREKVISDIARIKPNKIFVGIGHETFSESEWVYGLQRIIAKLEQHTEKLFLFRPTPHLAHDPLACLERLEWTRQFYVSDRPCQFLAGSEVNYQIYGWMKTAVGESHKSKVIDMNEYICPDGLCSARLKFQIVYRDPQHLTASFVEGLSDELQQEIDSPHSNE